MSKEKKSPWYKASDSEKIGNIKAIKNHETKEVEINSKKAHIYEYSEKEYSMLITKPAAMKKYLPESKWGAKKGEEILIRFPKEELEVWAKRAGMVNNRSAMIKRANEFGKPIDPNAFMADAEDDSPDVEEIETENESEQLNEKIAS